MFSPVEEWVLTELWFGYGYVDKSLKVNPISYITELQTLNKYFEQS